jgi:hypothetical protein
MEDRWFGNAFQIFEATDENDLEAIIKFRLNLYISVALKFFFLKSSVGTIPICSNYFKNIVCKKSWQSDNI